MFNKELNIENGNSFESFIGPWVLPNEEIPAHITWDEKFDFEQIIINFPDDLDFVELLNAVYKKITNSEIFIDKKDIKHLGHGAHPYFIGIIFLNKKIDFDGLKLFRDIFFRFIDKDGQIVKNVKLTAKIFRPKLINISEIPPILLTDDKKDYSVDINLEYRGFGFVSIKLEPEFNKSKIPFDKSIFEKVIENLEKKYIPYLETEKDPEIIENDEGFDIENLKIFMNLLEKYNKDQLTHEKDIGILMKDYNIEGIFISDFFNELIKELRQRYKYENIILNNTKIKIPQEKFRDIIHSSKIHISYRDLNDNLYEPIKIDLNLKDHRADLVKPLINFRIQIKKITDNAFRDIEKVGRNNIE